MSRPTLIDTALLVGLSLAGWAACGATMVAGTALTTPALALAVHALLAPVFFGIGAVLYFRRPHALGSPFAVAAWNVGAVIALDLLVVAPLVEHSFRMFASVAGTWLPFALIFASSWLVGAMVRARVARRASPGPEREAVDAFLAKRRIAFVGLSTDPASFSRVIDRELIARGYDIVPIHPSADAIEGRTCYRHVQDVPESVEGALIMTPAAQSAGVVQDCVDAGVRHVWLHRGVGPGAVSEEALALCREHRLVAVAGRCPMMFLPDAAGGHRAHAYLQQLAGTYPR